MDKFDKFTFILNTLYVDDGDDIELVAKKLVGYLQKIHSDKRRIVVYLATEPVVQEDGHGKT